MAEIRVESRTVVGGYGHLYLVYRPNEASPYSELQTISFRPSIPGLFAPWGLMVWGNRGALKVSEDEYVFDHFESVHGFQSDEDTMANWTATNQNGSRVLYSGPNAAALWRNLTANAPDYSGKFEYKASSLTTVSLDPTVNSNAAIGSLLHSIGIEIEGNEPSGWANPGIYNLLGTDAGETLTVESETVVLAGGAGDDTLIGDERANALIGGAGDDTFQPGAGDDYLHGGQQALEFGEDGFDTVDYSQNGLTTGITITQLSRAEYGFPLFQVTGPDSGTDFLLSVERAVGTAFDDIIDVGLIEPPGEVPGGMFFFGSSGSDVLTVSQTNSPTALILSGGEHADTFNVANQSEEAQGLQVLWGGEGADAFRFATGGEDFNVLALQVDGLTESAVLQLQARISDPDAVESMGFVFEGKEFFYSDYDAIEYDSRTRSYDVPAYTQGGWAQAELVSGEEGWVVVRGVAPGTKILDTESTIHTTSNLIDDEFFSSPGRIRISVEDFLKPFEGQNLTGTEDAEALTGGGGADILDGQGGDDVIEGGRGADTLEGSDGNDDLHGGRGNDRVRGGGGDDYLTGGGGADTIEGGDGVDTTSYFTAKAGVTADLSTPAENSGEAAGDSFSDVEGLLGSVFDDDLRGDDAANAIDADAGHDILRGRGGNDILLGWGGNDLLDGGAGTDIASYAGSGSAVTVSLGAGSGSDGDAQGDLLSDIESLVGSGFGDTLTGGGDGNELEGGDGDDLLRGDAGDDALSGDGGHDTIHGGAGADVVNGGTGTDTASYAESETGVTVDLGAGTASGGDAEGDTLSNIERLTGSAFADTLRGDAATNRLYGLAGADLLEGVSGDLLVGGEGDDTYLTNGGSVTEASGEGTDTVKSSRSSYELQAWVENLTLTGMATVAGGNLLDNVLVGNSGRNTLIGLGGADALDGGAGIDTASYVESASGVTVDLGAGTGSGGDAQGDTLTSIEEVEGSAFADILRGGAGADFLDGQDGADLLDGGEGWDTLIGGLGDDTYIVDSRVDVVYESYHSAGGGVDTVKASDDFELGDELENLTLMGTAWGINGTGNDLANTIAGNSEWNTLDGRLGADILIGGLGEDVYIVDDRGDVVDETTGGADEYDEVRSSVSFSLSDAAKAKGLIELLTLIGTASVNGTGSAADDTIQGNIGNNILTGLSGGDTLDGGAGIDTASYAGSGAGVAIYATGAGQEGDAQGDDLINIENLTGSAFADLLEGNGLANDLLGLGGMDVLDGGGGADMLRGGAGDDTLDGGTGVDTLNYTQAGAAMVLLAGAADGYGEIGAEQDTLRNIENVWGGAYGDSLTGDARANGLEGRGGDDVLSGGAGNDQLTGGGGLDRFAFAQAPGAGNLDTIVDFVHAEDAINLVSFVFGAPGVSVGGGEFRVGTTAANSQAQDANDYLIYNRTSGELFYDRDGLGGADKVKFAVLSGSPDTLAFDDFVIV